MHPPRMHGGGRPADALDGPGRAGGRRSPDRSGSRGPRPLLPVAPTRPQSLRGAPPNSESPNPPPPLGSGTRAGAGEELRGPPPVPYSRPAQATPPPPPPAQSHPAPRPAPLSPPPPPITTTPRTPARHARLTGTVRNPAALRSRRAPSATHPATAGHSPATPGSAAGARPRNCAKSVPPTPPPPRVANTAIGEPPPPPPPPSSRGSASATATGGGGEGGGKGSMRAGSGRGFFSAAGAALGPSG